MKTQHTPGPWYFSPSCDIRHRPNGEYIIQGSNDVGGGPVLPILGRTHNYPDNAEANARLIAAAPELLAALVGLYELCRLGASDDAFRNGVTDSTGTIDEGDVRASDRISAARAAIRKAGGVDA